MSSILKALKKLEEEKARRKGVQVDLVQNILRGENPTREAPTFRLPLLVLGLLLAGGLLGMLVVNWLGTPHPPTESLTVVHPTAQPAPPAPATTQPQSGSPSPVVSPPVPETVGKNTRAVVPVAPATPVPELPPSAPPVAEVSPPLVAPAATDPAAASAEPAPAAEPEKLLVSGIVYQQDPEGRIAVVNDLPVMQGTPVGGAVVEEILPDRVRFSRDGHSFEVLLQE